MFESNFKRNYIHVRDVANVFFHGIKNFEKMKNEIYNVGLSEANLSKKELCQIIKKANPQFYVSEAAVGYDKDKRNYMVSNKKIEESGFRTEITLDQGIEELIKGYEMLNNNLFKMPKILWLS